MLNRPAALESNTRKVKFKIRKLDPTRGSLRKAYTISTDTL